MLTGSDDQTARLWDVESGKELRRFEGDHASVTSVAFSPDGRKVLTGSQDKSGSNHGTTARLWDEETGKELQRFDAYSLTSVAFSPDGRKVLTGSDDKTARLWDLESGKELQRFEVDRKSVV